MADAGSASAKNRREYLVSLSDEFGVPKDIVFMLADILGPNEDYDGLVATLEDLEYMGFDF